MPRPLDTRLDLVAGRRTAGVADHAAATLRRRIWRAEAAMGAVIRGALARAGVDAAQATCLSLADEA
jgi:hypothetical protein